MDWFEIDRKGLARLLERRGLAFVIFELLQNSWDEQGASSVEVTLAAGQTRGRSVLRVVDNAPEGFRRLSDAWTLFATSYKAGNPVQRGRYNLGEKLVLALCDEASITSTKGAVVFDGSGRRTIKSKTAAGTVFEAVIRMTAEQRAEALAAVKRAIPPDTVKTIINGEVLARPEVKGKFHGTLLTEYADEDGVLRRTRRATDVAIYEPPEGDEGWIYEMGIPIVETGDRWSYDVGQKVPQSLERDGVPPSFLRQLRTEALNNLHNQVTTDDANETWVRDAASDQNCSEDAFTAVLDRRYGKDRVLADPSDPEATKRAMAAGHTIVYGNQLTQGERDRVRTLRTEGRDPILPAGQSKFATKPVFGNGEKQIRIIKPEDYTEGQKRVVQYSHAAARALIGMDIQILVVNEATTPMLACYRKSADAFGLGEDNPLRALFTGEPRLIYNLGRLGKAWFEDASPKGLEEVHDLLIHELGHQFSGDHLADAYHDALCRLGARLAGLMRDGSLDPIRFGWAGVQKR